MKVEYRILKEKIRDYNKKDAQFYSNIFAKMSKPAVCMLDKFSSLVVFSCCWGVNSANSVVVLC